MNPRIQSSQRSSVPAETTGPPVRLVDLIRDARLDPESAESRAASLLQRVPKAPALSSSAFLRIEEELLQCTAPQTSPIAWLRRLAWGAAAVSTVTASFLLGLSMRPRPAEIAALTALQTPRALSVHEVRLPRESQARLSLGHGDLLVLTGPAELNIVAAGVRFQHGQLRVEAGSAPLVIEVGSRRVTVAARASAGLSAQLGELVRVAAYVGAVDVRETTGDGSDQLFSVPAGSSWLATEPPSARAAPVGTESAAGPVGIEKRPPARAIRAVAPFSSRPTPPAAAPPPSPPPQQSRLLAESQLLGRALQRLHREHDARSALGLLDEYSAQFSDGALRDEASSARVDALLQLDRRSEALQVLDTATFTNAARGGELRLVRAELRAHAGRCREAVADFDAAYKSERSSKSPVSERALYGLATCRLQLGERGLAREALRKYLEIYPAGRFADAAREALGQL